MTGKANKLRVTRRGLMRATASGAVAAAATARPWS